MRLSFSTASPRPESKSASRRARPTSRRVRTSRSRTWGRSCARSRASLELATSCNGAGVGPARAASRSIISARRAASSPSGRCLIPADGFYEFTDPADRKKKRKDKWLFTKTGEPWFCIAGIWRAVKDVGEAFTMLTVSPGPDVAPYHDRQIAILNRADWAAWLDPSAPAKTSLKPLPAGSLAVEQVG